MALTDPELDLLCESLVDEPANKMFLQVGVELLRRERWADARQVLGNGLAALPATDPRRSGVSSLLARAALETGHLDLAGATLQGLDLDPARRPENARTELLWLERSGRSAEARERARALLAVHPDDPVARGALARMDAPTPPATARAADPLLTVARAERFAALGRPDRAIRTYHRVLLSHLASPGMARQLEQRVRQLSCVAGDADPDLSEELPAPSVAAAPSGLALDAPPPTLVAGTPPARRRLAPASARPAPRPEGPTTRHPGPLSGPSRPDGDDAEEFDSGEYDSGDLPSGDLPSGPLPPGSPVDEDEEPTFQGSTPPPQRRGAPVQVVVANPARRKPPSSPWE